MRKKDWLFAVSAAAAVALALPTLAELLRNTRTSEYYSHIVLIPFVSLYFLVRRRKEVFRGTSTLHPAGIAAVCVGAALVLAGRLAARGLDVRASLVTLGAWLLWCGTYLLLYGRGVSRRAVFPFGFLVFAVPIPALLVDKIIAVLVMGSAYMTRTLFILFGVPFVQEGPLFRLPGFSVEIAHECSGIRSSLALFITTVLAGHIFLRRLRSQILLALAVLPVALFKNAFRIATLYLLSYFIDIRIISGGFLHRSGGFIFFGLGLAVLGLFLWLLKETERRGPQKFGA